MSKETDIKEEKQEEKLEKKKESAPKEKTIKLKESEHQKLVEERDDYKDKYVRLFAEFDNARKRMDRERQDFVKYANENVLTEFLGILDNLERSIIVAEDKHQDYDAFLKGVQLIMTQAYDVLKNNGVKPMETQGKVFDPNQHEVLMQEETDDVDENHIMEEFQKGYLLHEKVIRTAKVKVAKKKT